MKFDSDVELETLIAKLHGGRCEDVGDDLDQCGECEREIHEIRDAIQRVYDAGRKAGIEEALEQMEGGLCMAPMCANGSDPLCPACERADFLRGALLKEKDDGSS